MNEAQKKLVAKEAVNKVVGTLKLLGINYFDLPKDIQVAMIHVFQSGITFSLEVAQKLEKGENQG